jgi:hypothetical protein
VQSANAVTSQRRWYKVDLHLHTPASHDYEEPQTTYLEWMRAVAGKGLEIVAITDHNTVAGIGAIRREIEWLAQLERTNRLTEEERQRLAEWRELSNQVLVLPGFEFTATFGFHILGIFPPETSVRHLEHILLDLKVPPDKLDAGSTETGSATDVLTAYRTIHAAGGLVIAAHANSTHGVAMRNFPFGGQTKIAYTQDEYLDALEVTDLDKGPRSTARFFNGAKTEYPRRMHCFHGSDAHRLKLDPKNPRRLGIGERASEFMLEEASFEALAALLRSTNFDRTRPYRAVDEPVDTLAAARDEGPGLIQSFHESSSQRSGKLTAILNDICAFANTAGGSIYVGAGPRKIKPRGVLKPSEVQQEIVAALDERMTPPLELKFDVLTSQGAKVLRIQVPKGQQRPYCLDDTKYYVRDEAETTLAVRDELVALIRESLEDTRGDRGGSRVERRDRNVRNRDRSRGGRPERPAPAAGNGRAALPASVAAPIEDAPSPTPALPSTVTSAGADDTFYLPQIGVEIVATEERNGLKFHSIRDLRNGHVIHNVTRKGARKLWSYAIEQTEDHPLDTKSVNWQGNVGLLHMEKRAGKLRYDLALRENGSVRVFYGVTEDGMEGRWADFIQDD